MQLPALSDRQCKPSLATSSPRSTILDSTYRGSPESIDESALPPAVPGPDRAPGAAGARRERRRRWRDSGRSHRRPGDHVEAGVRPALGQPLRLSAARAGRCVVRGDLQALSRIARLRQAVLHRAGHAKFAPYATSLDDAIKGGRPAPAVRDLRPVQAARGRALRRTRAACSRRTSSTSPATKAATTTAKSAVGGRRRRARRPVEAVGAKRLAAAEARGQEARRHPQDAGQALRELARACRRAQQRGRVPDVHERLCHVDRSAHQLPRPAHAPSNFDISMRCRWKASARCCRSRTSTR